MAFVPFTKKGAPKGKEAPAGKGKGKPAFPPKKK